MMQVKAENMLVFIQRERDEIITLWDDLYYSDEQRNYFLAMQSGG